MSEELTLVVLAAGMGSRYGGLKQIDPMGPHGETVLDYSIYDAIACGFQRVVFVIRRDIEAAFRQSIGARYARRIAVDYAFQEIGDLPVGFALPPQRTKPWGTAHALFAARSLLGGPFAVINADDFYGRAAYRQLADFLRRPGRGADELAMVAFSLAQTLSDSGSVNRGICAVHDGLLAGVGEYRDIARHADGIIRGTDPLGQLRELPPDAPVSMNFWGMPAALIGDLKDAFRAFLDSSANLTTAEFYLPAFVDERIRAGAARCHVLTSPEAWIGVTYPADKPAVQRHLRDLTARGDYPSPLLG